MSGREEKEINKDRANNCSPQQIEFDINKFMQELTSDASNQMTSQAQLKRLLNTDFISPYEALLLSTEATDEEIKRQYRQLSILVHPDKCNDSRAADAFHSKFFFYYF